MSKEFEAEFLAGHREFMVYHKANAAREAMHAAFKVYEQAMDAYVDARVAVHRHEAAKANKEGRAA